MKKLATLNLLRSPLSNEDRQKYLDSVRAKDFTRFWEFCRSDDEKSMDERTLRSIKGILIENLLSYTTDASHLDGQGFDLSWIDGEIYGEIKYQRQKGRTITRKLKNSLSLNARPECDIGFDVLLVVSPHYVRCFFSDELEGRVFAVSDGFELKCPSSDGHLIAECPFPDDLFFERIKQPVIGVQVENIIRQNAKDIATASDSPYRAARRILATRRRRA